jgi:hypothetical protein
LKGDEEMKFSVILYLMWLFCTGCGLAAQTKAPPRASSTTVSYKMPAVTPMAESQEAQEKDGVVISVSTTPFAASKVSCTEYAQAPTDWIVNGQYNYDAKTRPSYTVSPGRMQFKVKVINNLPQVLKLAGTLVRFQVDGKDISLQDDEAVKSFLDGILAPREQRDYEITGPDISALPDRANISLGFYSVVTATDAAGNPSKRSNYEWLYSYSSEPVTTTEKVETRTVSMRPQDIPEDACK